MRMRLKHVAKAKRQTMKNFHFLFDGKIGENMSEYETKQKKNHFILILSLNETKMRKQEKYFGKISHENRIP